MGTETNDIIFVKEKTVSFVRLNNPPSGPVLIPKTHMSTKI